MQERNDIRAVEQFLEQNRDRYVEELKAFLRIPSVSADSRHKDDVERACRFVADKLTEAGIPAEIIQSQGHPLVYGEWLVAKGGPTVLVYGHYDVQPPDPLHLWKSGPFEPTVRDGNIYARGATDDKGQMLTHVWAAEAWLKMANRLPINVKFLIEGEEEVGGKAITNFVKQNPKKLACDYVVISDTCMLGPDQPAITYGLKGIAYFELVVRGPNRDLHSGTFGGSVQNPANALAEILASLKDSSGRIQLPGFYDDVVEPTPDEREMMRKLPFDEKAYQRDLGVPVLFGESDYTTLERRWVRPTCDVNGIYGGYEGEGPKTVLPAFAGAKFSFRLVPNQDPEKVEAALKSIWRIIGR